MESSDFSEGDSAWSESVCSLDSSGGWGLTLGLLVCDVLSWLLGTSVLSSGVLCSCHFKLIKLVITLFWTGAYNIINLINLVSDWLIFSISLISRFILDLARKGAKYSDREYI